jgi:hypothetical protein
MSDAYAAEALDRNIDIEIWHLAEFLLMCWICSNEKVNKYVLIIRKY